MGKSIVANSGANEPISGLAAGTFCIWEHGSDINSPDNSPATDPINNLAKVAIHSDFEYLGVENVLTFSQALPAYSSWTGATNSYTLGAHGVTGRPLILARFRDNAVGGTWYTLNGAAHANAPLIAFEGHVFVIQVDATNVILRNHSWSTAAAITLDIEVFILDRTFDDTPPTRTDEVFYADTGVVRAAGGIFDTSKQYIQEQTTGTPDFSSHVGQSWLAQNDTNGPTIGLSTHFNGDLSLETHTSDTPPAPFNSITATNLMAPETPTGVEVEFSPTQFTIDDATGGSIFDSQRRMMAVLQEEKHTINIGAHATAGSFPPTVNTIPHVTVAVPTGSNFLFGWLEVTSSTAIVLTNKPIEFSGSIPLTWSSVLSGLVAVTVMGVTLSPKIVGSNLIIEEQWWNNSGVSSPAITVRVHMMVAALTGGF